MILSHPHFNISKSMLATRMLKMIRRRFLTVIQSHLTQISQNSNPRKLGLWTGFENTASRWPTLSLLFNSSKPTRKKIYVKVPPYLFSKAHGFMVLDALPTASCSCGDSTVSINTKMNNDNTIYLIIFYF